PQQNNDLLTNYRAFFSTMSEFLGALQGSVSKTKFSNIVRPLGFRVVQTLPNEPDLTPFVASLTADHGLKIKNHNPQESRMDREQFFGQADITAKWYIEYLVKNTTGHTTEATQIYLAGTCLLAYQTGGSTLFASTVWHLATSPELSALRAGSADFMAAIFESLGLENTHLMTRTTYEAMLSDPNLDRISQKKPMANGCLKYLRATIFYENHNLQSAFLNGWNALETSYFFGAPQVQASAYSLLANIAIKTQNLLFALHFGLMAKSAEAKADRDESGIRKPGFQLREDPRDYRKTDKKILQLCNGIATVEPRPKSQVLELPEIRIDELTYKANKFWMFYCLYFYDIGFELINGQDVILDECNIVRNGQGFPHFEVKSDGRVKRIEIPLDLTFGHVFRHTIQKLFGDQLATLPATTRNYLMEVLRKNPISDKRSPLLAVDKILKGSMQVPASTAIPENACQDASLPDDSTTP
ncbi:hypothetical protein EBR96_09490, partial [bacterium]|nr:hypothetical protein [bacterium]